MNKKKIFFLILIFLVLITLIFGFVYWLKNQKTEPEIPTLIPIVEPMAPVGGGGGLIEKP